MFDGHRVPLLHDEDFSKVVARQCERIGCLKMVKMVNVLLIDFTTIETNKRKKRCPRRELALKEKGVREADSKM